MPLLFTLNSQSYHQKGIPLLLYLGLLLAFESLSGQQRLNYLCPQGLIASLLLPVLLARLSNPIELLRCQLLTPALFFALASPTFHISSGTAHVPSLRYRISAHLSHLTP